MNEPIEFISHEQIDAFYDAALLACKGNPDCMARVEAERARAHQTLEAEDTTP